jgi:hypothetical protein
MKREREMIPTNPLGVGLYVMPIDVGIKATGTGASEEKFTAPLPTLALYFDIALTPKLFLRQGIEAFYLEAGNFRGGSSPGLSPWNISPGSILGSRAGTTSSGWESNLKGRNTRTSI